MLTGPSWSGQTACHHLLIVEGQDGAGLLLPLLDAHGAPLSAAGWTGRAQVRGGLCDQLAGELTVTCREDGVLITWPAAQLSTWRTVSMPVWDVVVTDLTGASHRIAEGRVVLDRGVTR